MGNFLYLDICGVFCDKCGVRLCLIMREVIVFLWLLISVMFEGEFLMFDFVVFVFVVFGFVDFVVVVVVVLFDCI